MTALVVSDGDSGQVREATVTEVLHAAGPLWGRSALTSFAAHDDAAIQRFVYWCCSPLTAPCYLIVLNRTTLGVEKFLLAEEIDIGATVAQMPRFTSIRSIWIVGAYATTPWAPDPVIKRYLTQLDGRGYRRLHSLAVQANKAPRQMSIPRFTPAPGLYVQENQAVRAANAKEVYVAARSLMARGLRCGQTVTPLSIEAAKAIELRSAAAKPPGVDLMFLDTQSRLVHYQHLYHGLFLNLANFFDETVRHIYRYRHGHTTLVYHQEGLLTRLSDAERETLIRMARRFSSVRVPLSLAAVVGKDGVEFYTTQGLRIHKRFLLSYLSTRVVD